MSSEHVEMLRDLSEVCRAAIKAGDWKVDGACDPDSLLRHADAAIASLSAPQPPAEAQAVAPMTGDLLPCPFCGAPAERIDFGPGDAENEGGSCIACTRCQSSGPVEFGRKENFVANWNCRTPPPSTPVGVEDGPIDASDNAEYIEHCADRLERCGLRVTAGALRVIAQEHRALAQQPAAVDASEREQVIARLREVEDALRETEHHGLGKGCGRMADGLAAQRPAAVDDTRRLEYLIGNELLVHRLSDTGLWMVTTGDLTPAIDGSEYDTWREAIDGALEAQQGGGTDE